VADAAGDLAITTVPKISRKDVVRIAACTPDRVLKFARPSNNGE
jgi:hypothetical protein